MMLSSPPSRRSLTEWLAWQERLHPSTIDLGLERVGRVWRRLGGGRPAPKVITVGGTNGKGSTVAILEAALLAAGRRVGAYTSPHLLRYNERIRIEGIEVVDEALCDAFGRVDSARGGESLTYFEFGTLAALDLFRRAGVEVALLEVGLGGRLDAVNVVDPDVAVVTSVGIDHTAWLGESRDAIGREKGGIFRQGRPALCGDPEPPAGLLEAARLVGADLYCLGGRYGLRRGGGQTWEWWLEGESEAGLPLPAAPGDHMLRNAATALAALRLAGLELPRAALEAGLAVRLAGRFQRRMHGAVEWLLDVAHNGQAAQALARTLETEPVEGDTLAVVTLLEDKDAAAVVAPLRPLVSHWYCAGSDEPRGVVASRMVERLVETGLPEDRIEAAGGVIDACRQAARAARPGDRILVFGSFVTVGEALRHGVGAAAGDAL